MTPVLRTHTNAPRSLVVRVSVTRRSGTGAGGGPPKFALRKTRSVISGVDVVDMCRVSSARVPVVGVVETDAAVEGFEGTRAIRSFRGVRGRMKSLDEVSGFRVNDPAFAKWPGADRMDAQVVENDIKRHRS